jgi:hypothetical protein
MSEKISVYQDLEVDVPWGSRDAFRQDMIDAASGPWTTDQERARRMVELSPSATDVILYRRQEENGLPEAGLTLWATETGYYVPNIVPLEVGQLSHAQYNAILQDFVVNVLSSVAQKHGATVRAGKDHETPSDWFGEEAAVKLKSFSAAANKSSRASHPLDERRWFEFIVAAHLHRSRPNPDLLARWLMVEDDWDEDSAHDLAGDFEHSLSLLAFYDESK